MNQLFPWLLAILSGLSLALAMPGPGLGPLALLFPFLLLEALERGRGKWRPWLLGLLAGTVFWTVSTNWVVPVMHHYGGLPRLAAASLAWAHISASCGRLRPGFPLWSRLGGGSGCSRWHGLPQRFFSDFRPMDSRGPDQPPRLSTGHG